MGVGLIAAQSKAHMAILSETVMRCKSVMGYVGMQTGADKLTVQFPEGKVCRYAMCGEFCVPNFCSRTCRLAKCPPASTSRALDINAANLVVWNGKKAETYEMAQGAVKFIASFNSRAKSIELHGDALYCAIANRIDVCNFQGVVQRALSFAENEGEPVSMDVWGDHLVVVRM